MQSKSSFCGQNLEFLSVEICFRLKHIYLKSTVISSETQYFIDCVRYSLDIRSSLVLELTTSRRYCLLSFLLQAVCLQRPVVYSSLNIYFSISVIILTL